jgi:hypothetical protein
MPYLLKVGDSGGGRQGASEAVQIVACTKRDQLETANGGSVHGG